MNLNIFSERISQGQVYQTPAAEIYIVITENTLAKSNTERIEDDDEEYGWD